MCSAARLSRGGWASPAGPAAKARSTLSVTCRVTVSVRRATGWAQALRIAHAQAMGPASNTPGPLAATLYDVSANGGPVPEGHGAAECISTSIGRGVG